MPRPLKNFAREMADFMPRYMREAFRKFSMAGARDITLPHLIALNLLKTEGRSKMNDIARAMHISTSAATGLVDRMVKGGYVKRVPGREDRRIINIEMTPKGRGIVEDIDRERYKFVMNTFSRVKPDQRECFLNTMKTIYNILREQRG